MTVSRETEGLLQQYEDLIRKWNSSINLVSPTTLADISSRHIEDSAQLYDLAQPTKGSWMDLGSGGGLPGIVLAVQARDQPLQVTLVESDKRKCAFLSAVRRELNLVNVEVVARRIEALAPGEYDYISARALSSLDRLMPDLHRQLAPLGEAWLLKGRNWEAEVADARRGWSFDLDVFQSRTNEEAAILKLRKIVPND